MPGKSLRPQEIVALCVGSRVPRKGGVMSKTRPPVLDLSGLPTSYLAISFWTGPDD